jgi:hypothetical protein
LESRRSRRLRHRGIEVPTLVSELTIRTGTVNDTKLTVNTGFAIAGFLIDTSKNPTGLNGISCAQQDRAKSNPLAEPETLRLKPFVRQT